MTEPGEEHASPAIRIGTAERNAALKALDAHLEAGRLDAMEYGDRSAHVAEARTADEIRPLFADLPAPHPQLPGDDRTGAAVETGAPAEAATTTTDRPAGGALQTWGPRLAGLMPLLALGLFFLVPGYHWWFFLLIPAAGMLLRTSGGDGHHDRRELHDHRDRQELPDDDHRDRHGERRRRRLDGRHDHGFDRGD